MPKIASSRTEKKHLSDTQSKNFKSPSFRGFYRASICEGGLGSRNSVRPSVRLSHACIVTKLRDALQLGGWNLYSQVGSVVRQSAKVPVRFPAAQKCWAQMEFVNIYQFRFHPMLKYACVYRVRFVLINLRHCGAGL